MDAGDVITIPTAIGRWKTVMVPVPSVESKLLQVGGALGVVVVVLEEDETPHAAAAAGHKAFNEAMQRELDALFPTFTIMDPTPTPDQLHELEDKISTAIHDAIEKKVNIGQWIAGWFGGGQDDKIGTFTRIWTHGDLEDAITAGPVDIYDVGDPLYPLIGGHLLAEEDGTYTLTGGRLTAKKFMPKLKLGPSAPPKKKPPKDPDLDGPEPHKPDVPGKKGPNPPN